MTKKYDAIKNNFVEYGRLEYINEHHNPLIFSAYKLGEKFHKLKQRIRDYDVPSRVYSRLGLKATP